MQDNVTRCLGLVTQYNALAVQPGALIQADDCVIRRENIVENRRGYSAYGSLAGTASQLMAYLKKVIAHAGSTLYYDNGSGTFSAYSGTYSQLSGLKIRSVETKGNLYFTTSAGVQVLTDVAGTAARKAGVPRSLDPSFTLANAATGFLSAGNQCAYRCVIQRTDANQNVLFGYPSTRLVVSNLQYVPLGTVTNASNLITSVSSIAGIQAGMSITGVGIPAGTTVSSASGTTVTMSANASVTSFATTGTTAVGSNQLTSVASSTGIAIGMSVTGAGIPTGTTVTAINTVTSGGSTTIDVTLSANATGATSGGSVTFAPVLTQIQITFGWNANVTLKLYLPSEVTTGDVIQVYRTAQYASQGTDLSGDEMALVYQASPTSADITNGFISIPDVTVDSLRGASLYASPSQEGMSQANDRPPLAKDMALFKSNFMFYANTSTKQRLLFTLVGTSGLSANSIVLGGVTYTFASSENAATGQVAVGATGIAAADIDSTARSLVRVINQYSSNTTVYAYYLSGPTDLPGQIMIEERGIGGSAYTLQASNGTAGGMFFPPPPASPATNTQSTSTNSVQKNAIYFSKQQQPEHVPALNYLLVGPANTEILRVLALRDSLVIVKEEGIYALRGDSPQNFTIVPLDLTVYCKARDSVCVLANQVFMLSNQGVVAISDTGVQVVSREIEPNLLPLLSYSNLAANTYGTPYESERSYFLSTVTTSTDTAPNQIYVFNIFTRTWTRWSFGWAAGVVEASSNKLYFGKGIDSNVYAERKSYSTSDYADPDYPITITQVSGSTVVFTVAGVTPLSGWAISQGTSSIAISSVVNTGATFTATLVSPAPTTWAAGSGTLYPAVNMQIKWDAWTAQQPGIMKHVRQFEILTDNITGNNQTSSLSATFTTDLDTITDSVAVATNAYKWGSSPWGGFPWGGRADTFAARTYVPRNKQYCRVMNAGVSHSRALERASISGCSYTFEISSERVNR